VSLSQLFFPASGISGDLMQQRQLRLGDILDDYCPRERRVTNHAVVAMVGDAVKQTRCTTCDAEHEYKHAKIPRQRKKNETPAALYAQVANGAPKRVAHEPLPSNGSGSQDEDSAHAVNESAEPLEEAASIEEPAVSVPQAAAPEPAPDLEKDDLEKDDLENDSESTIDEDEGPIHRRLIRASLPRPEGQQPPARPIPEFTIRQPGGGRPNRFRHRHRGGHGPQGPQGTQGHHFHGGGSGGNRPSGNMGGPMRGPRPNAGRPGMKQRHGPHGRKRSK
jgi:hypothetical protein